VGGARVRGAVTRGATAAAVAAAAWAGAACACEKAAPEEAPRAAHDADRSATPDERAAAARAAALAGEASAAPEPPGDPGAPHVDVAFCIDATGSMAGVIDRARSKIEEIAAWVRRGTPRPWVRYGLVIYRDRGDAEPGRSYGFLPTARAMRDALAAVVATGGGDLPEHVVGGLRMAVNDLPWDAAAPVKMLFLVGDAEPHLDYGPDSDDAPVLAAAKAKGIHIGTIACGGMTSAGHAYFKKVAAATGGPYQALPGTTGAPMMAEVELEDAVYGALRAEAARAGVAYPSGDPAAAPPGATAAPPGDPAAAPPGAER